MAAGDARPIPIRAQALRITFPILDADGDLVSGATGLDSEISKDGGAFTDVSPGEATEIGSSGMYYLDLSISEMTADTVAIIVKSNEGKTTPIVLYPVAADGADFPVNVESWNASAVGNLPTNFSSMGIEADGHVHADLKEWLGAAPAALSSQRVQSHVAAMGTDVITATAIQADAIGASEFAQAAADKVWSTAARALTDKAGFSLAADQSAVTIGTVTTLTGHTAQTGDTYAELPTNFSDLSISVTTGLVDITQTAADKAWSTAARALTDKAGFSLAADQSAVTIGTVTTLTGHTAQTGDTYAQLPTNFSDLSISVTTGLVDITQAAADKAWSTAARALTDKAGFSLAADQSAVTVGTVNALAADSVNASALAADALAEINAEVLDVLNVDTFSEPGQGAPPASPTMRQMLHYGYKAWRNLTKVNATTYELYNDAGAVVDQKSTHSDDATTLTSGEVGSGP
jgi:hypothetical protein